jgi:hypothetical protein
MLMQMISNVFLSIPKLQKLRSSRELRFDTRQNDALGR